MASEKYLKASEVIPDINTSNAITIIGDRDTILNSSKFTITDDTIVGRAIKVGNTGYSLACGYSSSTCEEIILYTGIEWRNSSVMPVIHISGYAYGIQSPVEFKIGFYIYNNNIGWCGVTNMGAWAPNVYLFKYSKNSINYVAVGLQDTNGLYYPGLSADIQSEAIQKFTYINLNSTYWSFDFKTTTGTIPATDGGVNCIQVTYKANILSLPWNSITGKPSFSFIPDYSKQYLTFTALQNTTFTFSQNALQYSLNDGATWTTLAANTASPTVNAGNKILWKQTGLTPISESGIGTFSATGNFEVSGNIMSLYYGDNFIGQTSLAGKDHAFCSLFNSNTKLVSAENLILPATTLAEYCYNYMFFGCTSLTSAPELPATTLATSCYSGMFWGCTSLTKAPELPATTLTNNCYLGMFDDCTSLVIAPTILPASTLTQNCYNNMFAGCTSLTKAPELPATTLASNCYYAMFYNCTSLVKAPELPATTLTTNCYLSMFQNCASLVTAPELSATTLANNCYISMFYGCTSLNYIKCLATDISANNCTYNWVNGVSDTGTFVKADNMSSWTTGNNGIPSGWTVYTESNWKEVKQYELKKYIFKGTCSTASATTAKEVTCPEFTSSDLVKGAIIFVTFDYTNSGVVGNLTMNVNGTSAKPIKKQYNVYGASNLVAAGELVANNTYMFQFDGTNWVCMTLDYNSNDPNFTLRHYYLITTKNELPQYTLSFLDKEIGKLIPFNSDGSPGSNTMTTEEFDPFSEILYHTNTTIAAGGTTNGHQLYYTYNLIDLRYTFNLPDTSQFTAREPVYIVCELQSSGKAKLVSPYYTKTLPTSNDGKLYIFLGIAYDGYRVELWQEHPIYYHNGTSLQKYGNSGVSSNGLSTEKYYLVGNTSDNTSILYRYNTNGPYMKGAQLYSGSDINYKTDIMPISNNFVNQLFERTDITYDFKWKDTNKDSSGFIAQWIEDIMPEVVDGSNETKHVNYDAALSKVVGAMFKKIQEQQKEIDELKIIIKQKGEA